MAWFLFALVAAALVGIAIWDLRRKAAAREAASKQRFEEMLQARNAAGPRSATPAAPAPARASPAPANAPAAAAALPARERFLEQRETLLYYLLKTGLPDHEIFANVSLASIVGAPASAREREQHLRRVVPYQLDFVVCDKGMRVVAAVEVEPAAAADAAGAQDAKADLLKEAGVRFVRINPAAPPRREQLRTLVIGGQPAPAS